MSTMSSSSVQPCCWVNGCHRTRRSSAASCRVSMPVEPRAPRGRIQLVAAVVGAASLGAEIAAARLLGAVAPYAVRLSVASVAEAGRVTGRLYAISTLGSLAGVFLAALVLVPFVGTRRTFLVFALALAAVSAVGLARRALAAPLAVAVLLALPEGAVKATTGGDRLLHETETEYGYARVAPD